MSLHRIQKHPGKIAGPAPLVSVIVPTMNRPDTLAVALDSLRRQTFRDFEVVIVNDAGEDPLPAIEPFAECLDILYLCHETNKGLPGARNTALRAARGRLIAYLDDDDFYYEDHLETLVDAIRKSGAAVVYSDANRAAYHPENGHLVLHSRRVLYSVDFDPQKLLENNITPVLCVMHEKSCLDETGYFREYLRTHEDWDLWMRLSRFYTFLHLPHTTCEYLWRKGDDTLSQDKDAVNVTHQYVGRIGKWLSRVPRVEESFARLGEAQIACRAPNAVYELSVIIYMSGATPAVEKCFAALGAALPDPEQTEIVLIADGAPELAQTLCQLAGEEMTVIEHPRPIGRTLAHNHAAKLARGKRLLFLSPEAALDPQALARMQAVGREHGGPAIITARLDAAGTFCYGGRVDAAGEVHPLREPPPNAADIREARVDCAPIACLLVSSALFQLLGGFRRRYAPAFFEDADFCRRAAGEFGIPTLCALDANAALPASGPENYAPAARVNATTFAADWGTSVRFGLDVPSAEWSVPFRPRQPPRITVLMPVRNGEAYLREAIDSILAQTLPEFVFLIINNGSTDATPAILEKYAEEDARIRIVTNEKDNSTVAMNREIDLIDTPYIAIMHADDIVHSERLELQLAYMESHPEVAALGCQMVLFWSESSQYAPCYCPTSPQLVRQRMYRVDSCLPCPGSMLRTADIKAVGGYREQFRLASDYDLWLRLLEKHELCNLPETLLSYRQHDASDSARHRTQLMIEHVLAMQSSEYRRQGKADPIADKELTLELLLSLFDPSQPSAYMWAKFLVFRSIDGRGRLLYDALAKILRYASSTRQTNEMIDLLGSYLNTKETLRIAQIFAEMPELYDEPDHSAVTHAIASLSQRRAGESSN